MNIDIENVVSEKDQTVDPETVDLNVYFYTGENSLFYSSPNKEDY